MEALGTGRSGTAINLKPQLIEKAISLQDIGTDMPNAQQYLQNDDLSDSQVSVLVQNILAEIVYQQEEVILQMQNLLLQIVTLHQLDQQQTAQVISVLVDLFNCEFLSVRRKSDEVLRALIEVADPV